MRLLLGRQPGWLARLLALATVFLPISLTSNQAAVLRVNLTATNEPIDGSSWTHAYRSLTNALKAAQSGDEIWVAAGSYPGNLVIKTGLALYGGFGGAEIAREERRPRAHKTVIDGGLKTAGFLFTGTAQPSTRVDGFTVQNCVSLTDGAAFRSVLGAPTIANNLIVNNFSDRYGAGIYLENSAAVISNNVITFNGLDRQAGGGGLMAKNSTAHIEGNTFSGNRARDGGALYLVQSMGVVLHNHFIANQAARDGGGLVLSSSSPQTAYNRFIGNVSGSRGGGAAILDGGTAQFFNNVLVRNRAATGTNGEPRGGGGLFVDVLSAVSVVNNTLVSNTAPVGGILCSNQSATLANNLVAFGSPGIGGAATLRLFNNCVFGNGSSNYVGTTDPTGKDGNLSANPGFGGDTALAVVNIRPDSPCRDAGSSSSLPTGPLVDIEGQPRVQGGGVDIGADESDGVTTSFLPTVVRVTPAGNDDSDGATWTAAKKTVQAGIEAASRTGGEVWVQAGTYPGLISLPPLTFLYGGFAGAEANRADRNWRLNETTLDGQEQGSVVTLSQLTLFETVDGFTISNGYNLAGGGVLADGDVRISNNRLFNNFVVTEVPASAVRGGAGVYVASGSPLILNNQFIHNASASAYRDQPAEGGALQVNDGTPIIANNLFRQNIVTNFAAGGEARGGAVCVVLQAAPQIINNTFLQNTALEGNGAFVSDQGGALYLGNTNAPARVGNNLIAYNSSGVFGPGQLPDFRNNLVFANVRTNYERLPDATGTNGNLSVSPRLTGPYGDPHLTVLSPCIDAGDDTLVQPEWLDFDGQLRSSNGRVDIGVDEFDGTSYPIADRIYHVRSDGDDAQDGRTWDTAKQTVHSGLAAASADGGEVWVKAGTYAERVRVNTFTYLYGGFAGAETNRADRNWGANPTVLSGDLNPGPPMVSIFGLDGYGAVSGFTIQFGRGFQGGGIFAEGSPRISDNIVRSNAVVAANGLLANGGGLYSQGGAPQIINNIFASNLAEGGGTGSGRGGAIYLDPPAGATPLVLNNTIVDNFAASGGSGLFVNADGAAQILNNLVAFNQSGLAAGSPAGQSNVVADFNCLFTNTAGDYANVIPGTNSLAADPRMVDPAGGDYRLRGDSPCLDAADGLVSPGELDIFGNPRVVAAGLDIGAAEFAGPPVADYSVTLSQPVAGAMFEALGPVFLAAQVTGGAVPPAYVEFSANDLVVARTTNAPYSGITTSLAAGSYQIVAKAVAATGSVAASAPVGILVVPVGHLPATVTFISPTNNQEVISQGAIDVEARFSFSKPHGRITAWTLFRDDTQVAELLTVPIGVTSASATVSNLVHGSHTFTAVVTSNLGDTATNSVAFSIVAPSQPIEPAVLQTPVLLADGSVRLEMTLPSLGGVYVLEASTNFTNWASLSTATGDGGSRVITNHAPATNGFYYYRSRGDYP